MAQKPIVAIALTSGVAVLAFVAVLGAAPRPVVAAERVVCHRTKPQTQVCRIDEPRVKQPIENFPRIKYQPGDTIVVDAGGCIHIGGQGLSWRRYVDPSGWSADKLYHGLIWIPGANAGLERIARNHRVFHVSPMIAPRLAFVRLGYEDDDYTDNNYADHDDGYFQQCKNSVNAFVVLTIVHHTIVGTATPPMLKPLDLVGTGFDDNGLLLQPIFAYERGGVVKKVDAICPNRNFRACTSQALALDTPSAPKEGLVCHGGAGHINFATATLNGNVFWTEKANSDNDYNLWLEGRGKSLAVPLTGDNDAPPGRRTAVRLEFMADETMDKFDVPWWVSWRSAVDRDNAKAERMVHGADAVVVGLIGFDDVHGDPAEIHPVYALAMRIPDHPKGIDRWVFFARNSGTEGFCSENTHYLDTTTLVLRLHSPSPKLHHAEIAHQTIRSNGTGVFFDNSQPDAALLVLPMPDPNVYTLMDGVIDLTWK